jgi:hypothetical protein
LTGSSESALPTRIRIGVWIFSTLAVARASSAVASRNQRHDLVQVGIVAPVRAARGRIRHTIKPFTFEELNEYLDLMRAGEVVGRAVMTF